MKRLGVFSALLLFLFLFGCIRNSTVTYTISGKVLDEELKPIAGVLVTLDNSQSTLTDRRGAFTYKSIGSGSHTVSTSKIGYAPELETFNLNSNYTDLKFELKYAGATATGRVWFEYPVTPTARDFQPLPVKTYSPATSTNLPEYDGLLVRFKEGVAENKITQLLTSKTQLLQTTEKFHNFYHLKVQGDTLAEMERLRKMDDVAAVQLNFINRPAAIPNDQYYQHQWNLEMINLPAAWDFVKGGDGTAVVAVLDSGIYTNKDLKPNLVPGFDTVANDTDPTDDVTPATLPSHGTHVSSIIAAVTDNITELAGAGWNLKVMPIKVFKNVNGSIGATDADVAEGIYKAVDSGANIINLSLGIRTYNDPAQHAIFEDAIKYAWENGVTVFAAAGNDGEGELNYPATSPYTIAVGAVGDDGIRADYSNYGSGLDLVAPGGHGEDGYAITDWILGYGYRETEEFDYAGVVGTSQATPHAAAVGGLLYAMGVHDPEEIRQILIDSATNKFDVTYYGAGILNAEAAMIMAIGGVQVCAATQVGSDWQIQSAISTPDPTGVFTVRGITENLSSVYIIGFIDLNEDGMLDDEDYFGVSSNSNLYTSDQTITGIEFPIYKISSLQTASANLVTPARLIPREQ